MVRAVRRLLDSLKDPLLLKGMDVKILRIKEKIMAPKERKEKARKERNKSI